MKFIADANPVFWWPVGIDRPDPEKAGEIVTDTLKMFFEAIPEDEGLQLDKELLAAATPEEVATLQRKRIQRICRDWDDVVDKNNKPIPFSPEILDRFCQFSWNRTGVFRAYSEAMAGKARLGN